MRRFLRRRRTPRDQSGFALLVVMGGMISLSLVVLASMTYVVTTQSVARQGQDSAGALQAAQAGLDDYLGRLAGCDSYWADGCGDTGNTALTGWATIAGTAAQYHYEVVSDPNHGGAANLLRLRSTGRIKVAGKTFKRTLVADLRKKSFLEYIYYTDREATAPQVMLRMYPRYVSYGSALYRYSLTTTEAAKCDGYYFATSSQAARTTPTVRIDVSTNGGSTWAFYANTNTYASCDIRFGPNDVIDGPLYTRDAILLNGPLFKGAVSTRWPASSTPAPNPNAWYRVDSGGTDPQPAGQRPHYDSVDVQLPPSNAALQDRTDPAIGDGAKGCPFSGPTRIVLNADGTMDVTSPSTTSTNAACGTASKYKSGASQRVPIPGNGVIYVSNSTQACSGKSLGTYPINGDITTYDCSAGDVFVEGTLNGRLTIASQGNIVITEDLLYHDLANDSLGLVPNGEAQVYHPVACSTTPAAGQPCTSGYTNMLSTLNDVTIDAAILSVNQSFDVQNFDKGAPLGTLSVLGGIYQRFRGPVGTSGSGYAKSYRFDSRLTSLPPPSFLAPVAAPWLPLGTVEVKNPTGLPS